MRPGVTAWAGRRLGVRGPLAGTALLLATLVATVSPTPAGAAPPDLGSLRFGGSGTAAPGADRVLIPVDPPTAADLGATDFTIELWMAATAADNAGAAVACDVPGYTWYTGRSLVSRDRFPELSADGRDFGAAVTSDGRIAFGVQDSGGYAHTACSDGANVLDGAWHHVALQRALAGTIEIWVDGVRRSSAAGPPGDISYPDGAPTRRPSSDPFLVIGAEKNDAGPAYPSYRGLVDEVRLSSTLRYRAPFLRPTGPFVPDATTAALYHLDGPPGACAPRVVDAAAKVDGRCVGVAAGPTQSASVPLFRGDSPPPAPPPAPPGSASFQPMAPVRLADTRPSPLRPANVLEVAVVGRAGIPAGALTAALNLTVTGPSASGYLTAWPCGQPRPPSSNLNFAADQTVANLAAIGVGTGGRVCIATSAATDVIVDISGWWAAGGLGYGAVAPTRLADTRPARVWGGSYVEVQVTGRAGVPATAQAAAVTITATGTAATGYVTAWPCGQPLPNASNLNFVAGQTVANLAAVALGAGGKLCVLTSATAAVVVDVAGWWGAAGIAHLTPGATATRALDTRPALVPAGGVVGVTVPEGTGVASLNLTVVGPLGTGYVAAFPCGQPTPTTSNLNFTIGQTVAGAALVPPGIDGRVCVFTSTPAALLVDVVGGMAVADVSTQALGGNLYALQWGYTQLGAPYAAINPYRFGDSTWGKRWACPSGWTSCALVDMHGGARSADTGDWVYDCSGFVVAAFQRAGVDLVRLNAGWSDAMYRSLPRVPVDQARPGDLLLFGAGPANPADPTTHVGMFLTADRMLNSTTACGGWQGVCTSKIDWTRVVAVARAPLPGTPGLTQAGDTGPGDPYGGVE